MRENHQSQQRRARLLLCAAPLQLPTVVQRDIWEVGYYGDHMSPYVTSRSGAGGANRYTPTNAHNNNQTHTCAGVRFYRAVLAMQVSLRVELHWDADTSDSPIDVVSDTHCEPQRCVHARVCTGTVSVTCTDHRKENVCGPHHV